MRSVPVRISNCQVAATLTPEMAHRAVMRALIADTLPRIGQQSLETCARTGRKDREYEHGASGAEVVVVLYDSETGRPLAVIERATLATRRAGAVAAICWRHFGLRNDTVAIIGCSQSSKEVVLAFNALKEPICEIRVYDAVAESANTFLHELDWQIGCEIRVTPDLETCLSGATTIVMTATGSNGFVKPGWAAEAELLLLPTGCGLKDETLFSFDKIVLDHIDQYDQGEKRFAEQVRQGAAPSMDNYVQLGEIVSGLKVGRVSHERVLANLMGTTSQDIAIAKEVYRELSMARMRTDSFWGAPRT